MKKVLALLMAMSMTASLVGCGGSGSDTDETSAPKTESTTVAVAEEATTVEATTEAPASTSTEMAPGVKGDGPQELTSVLFDVTIPEGMKYDVYTFGFADETNGSIELKFGKSSTLEACIEVSTQRMTKSLDEVATRAVELRNLDTYKEGKSEVGADVTVGDTTYREIKISNEWGSDTNYVSYFKTDAGLDAYVEITLEDESGLTFEDDLVKEILNSIVYKK